MELNHEFDVSVPPEQAWEVLTDLERIAPCMPGAQLLEVEGDEYRGTVKVKVGPITAQYKGAASFSELDAVGRKAVLDAGGIDTKGSGKASAVITARLADSGTGTRVQLHTDLKVSGKVAQFGRGVMADVSSKLMDQFVANLERDVLVGEAPAAPEPAPTGAGAAIAAAVSEEAADTQGEVTPSGPRRIDSAEAEPIDLVAAAGRARVYAAVAALIGLLVIVLLARRRRARDDR